MIPFRELCVREYTGTSDGAAGTRSSHAHGLSRAPNINRILIQAQAANDDADNSTHVSVVSVDATNVVVKANRASVAFTIFIFRQIDDAGRNID